MSFPATETIARRVIIFTGNYGSGKTEVSVNFTLQLAAAEGAATQGAGVAAEGARAETAPVSIVDMDIVNPYFRCREAIAPLEAAGIEVIAPRGEHFASELPIILPEVRGAIRRDGGRVVLDVGGDDVGARVLAGFSEDLRSRAEMLIVLNARRPFTDTVEGALRIIREIETTSRIPVTGLVANTHLMEYTTPELVEQGVEFALTVGEALSVPLRFVAVMNDVADRLPAEDLGAPVLHMERMMLPPWISPLRQGRDRFRQIGLD